MANRPFRSFALTIALVGVVTLAFGADEPSGERGSSGWEESTIPLASEGTDLVTIGARYQRGVWMPLFAIRRGNTALSEASSYRFSPYFGVNALDGSVYVRRGEIWRKITYVRPKTVAEIGRFLEGRASFTSETEEDLPEPFCRLAREHQDRIEYLVVYLSGGSKAYLKPGTLREEAQAVHGAVLDNSQELAL